MPKFDKLGFAAGPAESKLAEKLAKSQGQEKELQKSIAEKDVLINQLRTQLAAANASVSLKVQEKEIELSREHANSIADAHEKGYNRAIQNMKDLKSLMKDT